MTAAIITRLRKLDAKFLLLEKESAIEKATAATQRQIDLVRRRYELLSKLSDSEKELMTYKAIVESFQDEEYQRINDQLGILNKEHRSLSTSRLMWEKLIEQLKNVVAEIPDFEANQMHQLNAYERQLRSMADSIYKLIEDGVTSDSILQSVSAEERQSEEIEKLRHSLSIFLEHHGLSVENQSDAGNATQRIVELEGEIGTLTHKIKIFDEEIKKFISHSTLREEYASVISDLLAPVNLELSMQGSEVKPIKLGYHFDGQAFKDSMIEYLSGAIGSIDGKAPRSDYILNKLGGLDFDTLTNTTDAGGQIPDEDGVYVRTIREFISEPANFELLKLEAELRKIDVETYGQIDVLYDDKPVEHTSFGQRCTAVIVILILLGNNPVVVDEPEAHLDSSLIAKYLVGLIKSKKKHRQIIFATHNSNLVINGDADLVHCMSMSDTQVTSAVSFTIEDLAHRERLLSLEGGELAFRQREKRYGISR